MRANTSSRFETLDVADLAGGAVAERPPTGPVLVAPGYSPDVRWRYGERLAHLFEERCDRMREEGRGDHLAVDAGDVALTYDQLDGRANRLARHLLALGARPGDRIGLLFDRALDAYVGMLAVLKIDAAYVPLDAGFPADRLAYIASDAGVRMVLSVSQLRDRLADVAADVVCVDEAQPVVAARDGSRLTDDEKGPPVDELCYIIYTSGSTGRPKGVAIEHASICNFVRVAVEVYGISSTDRMYQGMTIAFDFSVEEIWVPLLAGATLVPKPAGSSLLGEELREFLQANAVSAMCCVPTLLATIDDDIPGLRFLLVSGEACPQDLVARWHRPDRRFLNVYGPTEATVTATWTPVHPERPVTLGVPLPTYTAVVLDPAADRALPAGELGEIGIAGIGLAAGYVNRADLTDRAFIGDFLGLDNNPSGRIYRTGDLGRITDDGEIEYHGRIDTQVKIRGYRIELTEIESVLLQVPGIAQAVVDTYEPEPGVAELVAYYSLRRDAAGCDTDLVYGQLRERLPGYMVPAYLEELAVIPMLPSDKADRKSLPPPSGARRAAAQNGYVAPTTGTERALADILAGVLRVERVSVDSHFFDDLGANSLLMARFCAGVRRRAELAPVSMKDVYLHPTVERLAATMTEAAPAETDPRAVAPEAVAPVPTSRYVACGALQLLFFVGFAYLNAVILVESYQWIIGGDGWVDAYARSLLLGAVFFVWLSALPIVVKWSLVGRWRRRDIPIWSLGYVRFWAVKTMIRSSPLALFAGSPIYPLYLRALGARVGRGVAIFSRTVPVCTDLLTIGDGAVIRKDASFTGYRAHAGLIQTGAVTIGRDAFVGEGSILDIDSSLGDGAQLGHASSLHAGQAVPDGERWHGSPAQPTGTDYRTLAPVPCTTLRRFGYGVAQLLGVLVATPVGAVILVTLLPEVLRPGLLPLGEPGSYPVLLLVSAALFVVPIFTGLAVVLTVPRLLDLVLEPDRVYPLYGLRYAVQRAITRITNVAFFNNLFGDSSYIVYYMRALGYDLGRIEQTGSNFGVEHKHDTPYLVSIGSGTMVSDGLSMINADYSATSFRVASASIGARSFLGNNIRYPAGAHTGENCLFGTKAMIPIDGPVRENVGLLGSPSFEIPRSVQRDSSFDHLKTGEELPRRLAAKNRHNLATIGLFLLVRWFHVVVITLLAWAAVKFYNGHGRAYDASVLAAFGVLTVIVSTGYFVLAERAASGFRALSPRFCSIYDPYFWWHERFWKLLAPGLALFNGTPFKGLVWRLLGVRVGRRLYDEGCGIPEKTLVTIGDDCVLNAETVIQCHSLEDGTFKSDRITLGSGCTLGVGAFVHYGVRLGDGAVLAPDSFLMKGEEVAAYARWGGNPARQIRAAVAVPVPDTGASHSGAPDGGALDGGAPDRPVSAVLGSPSRGPAPGAADRHPARPAWRRRARG